MNSAASTTGLSKWWADRCWKIGKHLDDMGRRLLVRAPAAARVYAWVLAGRRGRPRLFPGWTFACEYFVERRWMALRRGALWEFALERQLVFPLTVAWYGGTRVEVTLGNDQSLCLFVAGSFEPNEFAFLDRVVRPGMTFVDIGANEGLFTLFASRRVGRQGRVVSVEPSSRERASLEANLRRNGIGNVTVVPHALADRPGSARLQIAARLHGGHNTLGAFTYDDVDAVAVEEVAVETLDALAARLALGKVDVIKIDVEGAEVKVLSGGRALLAAHRPILLIEANDGALKGQGASTDALLATLRELGYRIEVFSDSTGEVVPMAPDGSPSANIVAVPST
ncbi:FkbM family methyltransferase [Reyranella sp.]|uniref:FkbM family methyltransferase n=1 Tax=Reyranella sp. TaxID=1929291 RepID=UPI003BABCC89